jgi:hypothetical protein
MLGSFQRNNQLVRGQVYGSSIDGCQNQKTIFDHFFKKIKELIKEPTLNH